jgi:hypothetical protein
MTLGSRTPHHHEEAPTERPTDSGRSGVTVLRATAASGRPGRCLRELAEGAADQADLPGYDHGSGVGAGRIQIFPRLAGDGRDAREGRA